jgi:bifunctional DNA-binding transcriptional regulator/antitoxin component of YhaV-PrlF toxin-antitoxin module
MDSPVIERRHVRLHKVGGSRSLVVPKEWLERQGIGEEADLVLTAEGIRIEAVPASAPTLDDEPLFPSFLEMLLQDALAHPEKLFDAEQTLAADKAWLAELGIE